MTPVEGKEEEKRGKTSRGSISLPLTLDDMTDEQKEEFNIEVRKLARQGFFQKHGLSNSQVQKTLDRLNRTSRYEPVEVEADEWEERTPLEEIPEFDPAFKKSTIFDSIRTKKGKRDTVDWQNKGLYEVEYQVLKFEHEENGEKPSVREIFYRLEANGLVVKTKWAYGTYDDVVTDAIKRGWLPPDLFAEDDTRPDIELWWVWFPHQWADMKADEFKNSVDSYYQPLWYKQPKFVIVITEKVALKPALHNVCDPLQVPVAGNRGWAGLRYLFTAFIMMLEQQKGPPQDIPKEVAILYVGDLDPSGFEMTADLKRRLNIFNRLSKRKGGEALKFTLKRVSVEIEQVEELELNWIPGRDVKDKLLGISEAEAEYRRKHVPGESEIRKKDPDPNAAAYIAMFQDFIDRHRHEIAHIKTGDDEFSRDKDSIWFPILELEAVTSLRRPFFRKLIRQAILEHYDKRIWNQYKDLFNPELVREHAAIRAKEIAREFEQEEEQ